MKAKHLFLSCALGLAMMSCSQQQSGYSISGTAEGTQDGDTVFLCEMQGFFGMMPLDTTVIDNGEFQFSGQQEGAVLRFLVPVHQGIPVAMSSFVLENAAIKATLKTSEAETVIEGGPNQQLFDEFGAGSMKISEMMEEPGRVVQDSTASEADRMRAQAAIDSLSNVMKDYHKTFIADHASMPFADMILAYIAPELSEQELDEVLALIGEKQPEAPTYKAIMAERKAAGDNGAEAQFIDFEMATPEGKMLKMSDVVNSNKYTLIDFWASWCGPCRAEMPTVVKAYANYHAKGFEVVGVSLDNEREAWLNAIEQLQMPWPHVSDLKGWECEGARLYHVQSIPANILVDQQGKIVASNLRGEGLLNKLAEIF